MKSEPPQTGTEIFARVLRGVLRPLVRVLIAQGITVPALYRLLKRTYVEVAEDEFALDGKRLTDSRISVLTGVHRSDVREFRKLDRADDGAVQEKVAIIASVIGRWLASPEMTEIDGTPRALPRTGEGSFDLLASSVSKDVRPRTVLDELVRQGLVELDSDANVRLRADAFVGPDDMDQRIHFFGENVGDHIAAAADNLLADEPRYLERAVFYNRLTTGSVDAIETLARKRGGEVLSELNRVAHDRQADDVAAGKGDTRFRFGVFFYRAEDAAEQTDGDSEGPDEDH